MAKDFESIIKTGVYLITLSSRASGGEVSLSLEYNPIRKPPISSVLSLTSTKEYDEESFNSPDTLSTCEETKIRWSICEINDFVLKLGFLDEQKIEGHQIHCFLHITEVCM